MNGPCLDPGCDCYAEIERLKKELAFQTDMACQADVAYMGLKALLTRAADALANANPGWSEFHAGLIKDLRKAAE